MANNFKHITYNVSASTFKERYTLLRDLDGGMSKVYLALDNKYKRKVVLKFFDPKVSTDPNAIEELIERFALETEISSQLNHPNTVKVYETGKIGGHAPFITMEFVDGYDLDTAIKYVKQTGEFSIPEFLLIFYQICEPIEIAHNKGILNRDIKTKNVLLGKYGDLKVCDWGIAKHREKENKIKGNQEGSLLDIDAKVMTLDGVVMGTARYFTPEQIRGEEIDEKTDIFLLTSILYEGITGHAPYSDKEEAYLKRMVEDDHSFDTSKLFVPDIADIILTGMAIEKEDRFRTVRHLKREVKTVLNALSLERYKEQETEKKPTIFAKVFSKPKAVPRTTKENPEQFILSDVIKKWIKITTEEIKKEKVKKKNS